MQDLLPRKPNIIRDSKSLKNNGTKLAAFSHGHCEPIRVKCNILVTNLLLSININKELDF